MNLLQIQQSARLSLYARQGYCRLSTPTRRLAARIALLACGLSL